MIVKMSKYTFVLYHKRQEEFLASLQDLGLVDITTTGWEANDSERAMITDLERHRAAETAFKELEKDPSFKAGEPYPNGEEAFGRYQEAVTEIENLRSRIEKARKEAEELRVWGDFSPDELHGLSEQGVVLRFFSVFSNEFDAISEKWGGEIMIEPISSSGGHTYFVVVQTGGQKEIPFDAQEHKLPVMTSEGKETEITGLEAELENWQSVIARSYASREMIAGYIAGVKDSLDFSRASNSGQREAEDTLVIMEGWATRNTSEQVDKLLEEWPDVVYIKEDPSEEDDAPVVLKNNKAASPFEFIGQFYSLPKYGTIDLTAFFAPFYMVFFGLCLGDAGYGLIIALGGLYLMGNKKPVMKKVGLLTLICGVAAVIMGFLTGGFFGVSLPGLAIFEGMKGFFLNSDNLFALSLILGVVQLYFAFILRVVNTTITKGFKYSLGTIGWMMVVPYFALLLLGMLVPDLGISVNFSSPVNMAVMIVGAVLMLFFHNPDKKPWINVGSGLWNTYNDVTGFLGDFLSYIRLFALCMSGGTLALVFNQLAFGMTDGMHIIPRIVVASIILLIGHGINLFMSFLGAFVHPMRLTFVEFYKNAGFEAGQREFAPLKRNK